MTEMKVETRVAMWMGIMPQLQQLHCRGSISLHIYSNRFTHHCATASASN